MAVSVDVRTDAARLGIIEKPRQQRRQVTAVQLTVTVDVAWNLRLHRGRRNEQ